MRKALRFSVKPKDYGKPKAIYNGAQAIIPYINDAAAFIPYLL